MATEIFTYEPEIEGLVTTDILPTLLFQYAGKGVQQRATLQDVDKRRYSWPLRRQSGDKTAIKEFFRLRSQTVEAFYIKDPEPDEHARTGVSLGTSESAQTIFFLPTTGDNSRDHPIDDVNVVVYDDGSPVAVASVDTDFKLFTLSASPTVGSVMTCDYHAYRLVHLMAEVEWARLGPDYFSTVAEFEEVVE